VYEYPCRLEACTKIRISKLEARNKSKAQMLESPKQKAATKQF